MEILDADPKWLTDLILSNGFHDLPWALLYALICDI